MPKVHSPAMYFCIYYQRFYFAHINAEAVDNAGPIAHLAGSGPIKGHIHDESALVSDTGLSILIEDHIIKKIAETEELKSEFSVLKY